MAKMTLDELTQNLKMNEYTPRTDEQLQQEAQNRYSSTYNQKRQTARQSYDTKNLAYENQLQSLQDTLRQNQQDLAKQTENSRLQAARYQITRGMQRSSYGAANDANIMNSGLGEQQKLMNQFGTDSNAIKSNQTLLAQQLADTLAGYDVDYLNDVNAYIDEQKQLDYDRQTAADKNYNDLQMALYEYGQKAKSGGGGGRRSGTGNNNNNTDDNPPPDDPYDNAINQLGGSPFSNPKGTNPTFTQATQTTPKYKNSNTLTGARKSNAVKKNTETGTRRTTK